MIIGRGGKGLEEVKSFVLAQRKNVQQGKDVIIDLKIEPVKRPYLSSYFVSQSIADKLARNFPHRGVVHNSMNRVREAGAKGVKDAISISQ